jgi:hypothetical protein
MIGAIVRSHDARIMARDRSGGLTRAAGAIPRAWCRLRCRWLAGTDAPQPWHKGPEICCSGCGACAQALPGWSTMLQRNRRNRQRLTLPGSSPMLASRRIGRCALSRRRPVEPDPRFEVLVSKIPACTFAGQRRGSSRSSPRLGPAPLPWPLCRLTLNGRRARRAAARASHLLRVFPTDPARPSHLRAVPTAQNWGWPAPPEEPRSRDAGKGCWGTSPPGRRLRRRPGNA